MRHIVRSASISILLLAAHVPCARAADASEVIFVPGTGAGAEPANLADDTDETSDETADETAGETSGETPAPGGAAKMRLLAERLGDPAIQDGVANFAEGMGNILLNLPIGRLAAAAEKARPGTVRRKIASDATVADIAGPDAHLVPAKLAKQSRVALSVMSEFAGALASMIPALENLGRNLEKNMASIKAKNR